MRINTTVVPTPAGSLGLGGCSAPASAGLPVGSVAVPAAFRLRGSRVPVGAASAAPAVRVEPVADRSVVDQPVAAWPFVPTQPTDVHTDVPTDVRTQTDATLGFHPSGRPLS